MEEEILSISKFPAENPNPVLRISKEGFILYSNNPGKLFLDAWGCKANEAIPGKIQEIVTKLLAHGTAKCFEDVIRESIYASTFTPVVDKQYVNIYGYDVTNLHTLQEQVEKNSQVIEQSMISIVITDTEGNIQYANPKFTQLTGYTLEEAIGKNPRILKSNRTPPETYKELWETITSGKTWEGEFCNKKKTGDLFWEHAQITPMKNRNGIITNFFAMKLDITQFKHTEAKKEELREQLYHAQKMESVGRLAGGIAHDFNNILMAIKGYADLSRIQLQKDNPITDYIKNISDAADSTARLSKKLLTFSRKQPINVQRIDLNTAIRKAYEITRRLLGEDIEYTLQLENRELPIMADIGQIEQVIMNLSTNARDAMPLGGTITITTGIYEMKDEFINIHGYGKKGTYAFLSVSDTGEGMDRQTHERIFEPFFTTKEFGRGTGLGLSIVYGIVKQHDGYIDVHSEKNKGAAFYVYFPTINTIAGEKTKSSQKEIDIPAIGLGTILVADDDESVRFLLKSALEKFGYTVITAIDGKDAVEQFVKNKDAVDLLLLDVKMPKKNGKEAHEEIKKIKRGIKTIFISGYSEDVMDQNMVKKEGLLFLQKPFPTTQLIKIVNDIVGKK